MSAGDDGGRWWSERDRVPDPTQAPDDMSARAAAAARAFAALGVTDRADVAPAPSAADPPTRPETGATPLRPDAVLRGRRFTPADRHDDQEREGERDHDARTERRRAFDERRRAHGTPPEDDARPAGDVATSQVPSPDAAGALPADRPRDRALLHVLALAVASGALVAPVVWPVAVALGAAAGATARSVVDHGPAPGPFLRRATRRTASCLRPRSLLWLPVLLARTVLIAIALPALLGAARWLITEGTDGLVAAARAAMWADGFRAAAAVVCFMLVTGVGDARHRRAAQLRRALEGRGPAVPVALAGAAVAATVMVVSVVPRAAAGGVTGHDGLAWVPAALHGTVDGIRDDIAVAEIQSASECLSGYQGVHWQAGYTRANAPGDDDAARLIADGGDPSDDDLATAGVALQDLLAPWVDTIVVEAGGEPVLVIDRDQVAGTRLVTEASALVTAADVGRDAVERGAAGFDPDVALDCASPPLP